MDGRKQENEAPLVTTDEVLVLLMFHNQTGHSQS